MICENGRCNSEANAELWSSILSRYGRYFNSVSMLHLSERDFGKTPAPGSVRNAEGSLQKPFKYTTIAFGAECSRLAAATIGSETAHWKQPRRESHGQSHERSKSLKSTSTTKASIESNTKQGTLSELAERLGNFHESANALTNCPQTRDTARKTDQSVLEAAKSMC